MYQLTDLIELVHVDQAALAEIVVLVRADQLTKTWSLVRADQEAENRPAWLGPRGPARGSPWWLLATVGGEP